MVPRSLILAAALIAGAARAHFPPFQWVEPSRAAARSDGGLVMLRWIDGPDLDGTATLTLFARRPALTPWDDLTTVRAGAVSLSAGEIPVDDPLDAIAWDASRTERGCYQPFVVVTDLLEGSTWQPGLGQCVVDAVDGGNLAPSIWVTSDSAQPVAEDGTWTVTFDVDDPDDATLVTLWLVSSTTRQEIVVARDLPMPRGGGSGTFALDTRSIEPGVYGIRAVVRSPDSMTCDAWQSGFLTLAAPDAGRTPEPVVDAGSGTGQPPGPRGCGCSTGVPALLLAALALARRTGTSR